jgi:hypothetical protein
MRSLTLSIPAIICCALFLIAAVAHFWKARHNPHIFENTLLSDPFDRAIYLFFLGCYAMYTYILSVAMAPFRCYDQPDGSKTLVPSSNLDCFDEQWRRHGFSIALGMIYTIFLPFFFAYVLWANRANRTKLKFVHRFGFLTVQYKSRYYFWSVFQLLRKTVLVMVIDLSNSYNPYFRVFLTEIVLIIFMMIEGLLQPRHEQAVSRVFSTL